MQFKLANILANFPSYINKIFDKKLDICFLLSKKNKIFMYIIEKYYVNSIQ